MVRKSWAAMIHTMATLSGWVLHAGWRGQGQSAGQQLQVCQRGRPLQAAAGRADGGPAPHGAPLHPLHQAQLLQPVRVPACSGLWAARQGATVESSTWTSEMLHGILLVLGTMAGPHPCQLGPKSPSTSPSMRSNTPMATRSALARRGACSILHAPDRPKVALMTAPHTDLRPLPQAPGVREHQRAAPA